MFVAGGSQSGFYSAGSAHMTKHLAYTVIKSEVIKYTVGLANYR